MKVELRVGPLSPQGVLEAAEAEFVEGRSEEANQVTRPIVIPVKHLSIHC